MLLRFKQRRTNALNWATYYVSTMHIAEYVVPVVPVLWDQSSGQAAWGPWHQDCGWWQSKTSWFWAGDAWRTSACVWTSVPSCNVSHDPGGPRHSHCNSTLEVGEAGKTTLTTCTFTLKIYGQWVKEVWSQSYSLNRISIYRKHFIF